MPLGKYHIVIFKDKGGGSRNLRLRGWLGVMIFIVFASLVGGNIWLWQAYSSSLGLQERLLESEAIIKDQHNQIANIVVEITELQGDLTRIQQFDTKLRIMMNMERDTDTVVSNTESFSRSYLPIYRQELMLKRMNTFLKQLGESLNLEEVRQQELVHSLRENQELLASMPSIWPVEGFLSSRFGHRISPFTGRRSFHQALDISSRTGTPIVAPAKGAVIFCGFDGAYGNTIKIQHGPSIVTRYAHLQKINVKVGQSVRRGTNIGTVGNTGRSSGPHLHYEVLINGIPVDPISYILN